jgi:chromosomal replication initiator protein
MAELSSKENLGKLLSEERKSLNWNEALEKFKATFGNDVYESWIKNIDLKKEFDYHIVLSAPTRFMRDWIVSRYADKILDIVKTFNKDIQRIEFLIGESEQKYDIKDSRKNNKISLVENSVLNYNRFNSNNNFDNFVVGESNELAYMAAKKICISSVHYNPLFIYSPVGMVKIILFNAIGLELV